MNLTKKLVLAAAAVAFTAPLAMADLVFPSLSYRTGPYAPNGIPFADGFEDYITLLNERDGGIGGEKIRLVECETGYNTTKGVECYESVKAEGALFIVPNSTGITYQLIPKATADDIPLATHGYGRTSAANGDVFSHVFNFPGTYWDVATVIVKHMKEQSGGSLEGKKIALVYHNSAYGKEPIRTLEENAKKDGFELMLLPVDHPGQEQKATWLQIRKERPDFVTMWGWGVMNQVAIQEAAAIRFPMENFIGVWWSGAEQDVVPAGDAANGYKAATFHNVGTDYPLLDEIKKHVHDKGNAAGDGSHIGTVLYYRGIMNALWAAEAVKKAQEMTGKSDVTAGDVRDGYENLVLTEEDYAALGLPNFTVPINVTCQNHGGPGLGAIQQWDAASKTWSLVTDFIEADRSIVDPLIAADAEAYAKENNIAPQCK
ncbi:MAG: ABC transporter substrate-binding protein [Pseudomonadota bacterium]